MWAKSILIELASSLSGRISRSGDLCPKWNGLGARPLAGQDLVDPFALKSHQSLDALLIMGKKVYFSHYMFFLHKSSESHIVKGLHLDICDIFEVMNTPYSIATQILKMASPLYIHRTVGGTAVSFLPSSPGIREPTF